MLDNPTDRGAVSGPGYRLAQFNGFNLEYDADGNVTRKWNAGFEQRLWWNSFNQLDSVQTNGVRVAYGYDGFGRRVRSSYDAGRVIRYLHDGDNLLLEMDGAGNVLARYTYLPGIDNVHSVRRSGQTYYFATDQQRSVLAVFDAANQVVNQYRYGPFGTLEAITETVENPLRYTGREFEAASGLYFYRARWYDPALHRFLSEDPLGISDGLNLYTYVGNDPINYTDPLGLYAMLDEPKCLMGEDGRVYCRATYSGGGIANRTWYALLAQLANASARQSTQRIPNYGNFSGSLREAGQGAAGQIENALENDCARAGMDLAFEMIMHVPILKGGQLAYKGARAWNRSRRTLNPTGKGSGNLRRTSQRHYHGGKSMVGVGGTMMVGGSGLSMSPELQLLVTDVLEAGDVSVLEFIPFVSLGKAGLDAYRACR